MIDSHKLLTNLANRACDAPSPEVDVRDRVMRSVSRHSQVLPPDPLPIAFCGVVVALATSIVFAFFPFLQTLTEPWACYLR